MSASQQTALVRPSLSRHVTAVLGPTNTGKTHLAIERMLGHESGLIGLPLRLLARETYDKIAARIGPREVALITGEEKIKPERPRYWVCTVEAMPREVDVDFLAVDEVQLAADPDRGHVFTDRLFHSRGRGETLLLGADTMADSIRDLIPGANFISRPRLSKLTYAGQKKITRLPSRSAIVAFSANDVYAVAELIRRQRGGAAVVMGALSPRTRNAQVALYQSSDVDFLVATDAIGMGLNLDVDHVAFAGVRKFDGRAHRNLTPAELAQIAGRAGRHLNGGTFGVTADVEPFDQELVNSLENHSFEPLKLLQWRNTDLDFASIERLKDSLRQLPGNPRLVRARAADDVEALEHVAEDPQIKQLAAAPDAVKRLWDACQVPDYRKVSPASHAELVATLYKYIVSDAGVIPEDWFAGQVEQADRTSGDIDTLSNRIAHIRTWTFVSNRREWLKDPDHWQARTRDIEDRLSDALHEQLTQRFVDKRTSVLMKSMRDKENLFAEIEKDGRVVVERQFVGKLEGFRFTGDTAAAGVHGRAARNAAAKVLVHELAARADRLAAAPDTAFTLSRDGGIFWEGQEIGRLVAGGDPLKPGFSLHADEHLAASDKDNITKRMEAWLAHYIEVRLKPLVEAGNADDVTGLARGIAFRLRENFGVLKRDSVADEIKSLDQEGRAQLRKYGVRFGAHNIYFPLLLKPGAADLLLLLWLLKLGAAHDLTAASIAEAPRQGLTSMPRNTALPEPFYRAAGFNVCGPRAVRIDMLERLADLIRPLTSWRPTEAAPEPPAGAVGGGAFKIRPEMMSIMGCSGDELGLILESLGFRREKRPIKKIATVAPPAEASAGAAANDNIAPPDSAGETPATRANGTALNIAETGEDPLHTVPEAAPNEAAASADESAASIVPPLPLSSAGGESPEFEEIWRFRRPRPKFEHGQTHDGARERRPSGGERQRGNRPRDGRQPAIGSGQPHPKREKGRERNGVLGRKETAARRPDSPQQEKAQGARAQPAKPPALEVPNLAAGGDVAARSNEGRRPQAGRPGGNRHSPAHPQGPQRFAASAAPKKATGGVDPDSPFAALGQLKERLEKQVQARDEAV